MIACTFHLQILSILPEALFRRPCVKCGDTTKTCTYQNKNTRDPGNVCRNTCIRKSTHQPCLLCRVNLASKSERFAKASFRQTPPKLRTMVESIIHNRDPNLNLKLGEKHTTRWHQGCLDKFIFSFVWYKHMANSTFKNRSSTYPVGLMQPNTLTFQKSTLCMLTLYIYLDLPN